MAKKLLFTPEELRAYFNGEIQSINAEEARKQESAWRVHADGLYPVDLIEERRPHEDSEVKAYREKIWKPKTKGTFNKILNSLSKIRRSSEWSIDYPSDTIFSRIPDGETLEDYCEKNYPTFKSLTNWAFSILIREYLIDPNAVILVMPSAHPQDVTELVEPTAEIFNSGYVIDFKDNNFAVIKNPLGVTVYDRNGRGHLGDSYYIVTTAEILKYDQATDKRGEGFILNIEESWTHNFGFLPVKKIGAVLTKTLQGDLLYESRISGALTSLDEAVREYSDLQASKVMHIYPERWEITQNECKECDGLGKLAPLADGGISATCSTCDGRGFIANGPYSKILLTKGTLDSAVGNNMPIPPAGFVEKDVEIVKLQDEGVKAHLTDALGAINMEHLAAVPLSQSGIAKEVDRDETTNFVHSVAEDLVANLDWVYKCTAYWRYLTQYSSEQLEDMLPTIEVPEHFDIFSTKYIEEEVKVAKENKLNPVIIGAMEINYASKKFVTEPEVRDRLMLILELDPLPNVSDEDKMVRLSNKGIMQTDYIISSNIQGFIQRALMEDADFSHKTFQQKKSVLLAYAKEIENAAQVKAEADMAAAIAAAKAQADPNEDPNNEDA